MVHSVIKDKNERLKKTLPSEKKKNGDTAVLGTISLALHFTESLIKALHALTRVSIFNTEGETRILDVELQNQILLCAEESRVISAACAAPALGDRCLASINIPIPAPALQPTSSLSTEMSPQWRSRRSPDLGASGA